MTEVIIQNQWEKRRTMLSHDLLKNKIGPAISKLKNIATGKVEDPDFISHFFHDMPVQLSVAEAEIDWLVKYAAAQISPKLFFNYPPLSRFDEDTLAWLPQTVHDLWATKVNLRATLKTAIDLFTMFKEEFILLKEQGSDISSIRDSSTVRRLQGKFIKLSLHITDMRSLLYTRSVSYLKGI